MIALGDTIYYVDLKQFEKVVTLKTASKELAVEESTTVYHYDASGQLVSYMTTVKSEPIAKEIDLMKYEQVKLLLDVVMDGDDEINDDSMGAERALGKASVEYKLAFNTLLKEGIIKEMD